MQFSQSVILSVATLLTAASAENILVALKDDVQGNVNQYLSFVQANTQADVAPLLSLYQAAQTYTDDSYTTLVGAQELSSLSEFATALPWYSSRIEPKIAAATSSEAASSSSEASSSSSSEASASSSASVASVSSSVASVSSSAASVTSSASEAASSAASVASSATSAAGNATSSVSTAGAAYVAPGAGFALALGAIALL